MTLFDTNITDLFHIRFPIIQAPMNWATDAKLVAAVSEAGGLGVLGPNAGASTISTDPTVVGERLRSQIRLIKDTTDKPFGVNFPIGKGASELFSDRSIDVALEEGIPIAITALGSPAIYTKRLQDKGITVVHAVSSTRHARKAEESGVNAVVAEGFGGGGHTGYDQTPTMQLIPQVVNAVKIPVIAGGGIADARGMLAALFLGAGAVYMGTRFLASEESPVSYKVKEKIVSARDDDITSFRTNAGIVTGIRNKFTDSVLEMLSSGKTDEEVFNYTEREYRLGEITNRRIGGLKFGDTEQGEISCGRGAGIISSIEPAGEIIERMMREALATFNDSCKNSFNS